MAHALFAIPSRIRRAVLNMLHDAGARRSTIIWELGKRRGFSNLGELIDYLDDTYGESVVREVAERYHEALLESVEENAIPSLMARTTELHVVVSEVLRVIPDDQFIAAVELGEDIAVAHAFEAGGVTDFRDRFQAMLGELFVTSGVPYHFEGGHLVPSASPTVSAASVQPAVDALDDARFSDARAHYLEALRRLQEPDPDEALDEARQAVEAALLAVLDAHAVPRPARHQANDLFNALVPSVMTRDAEELVLGVPRFRGRTRAGHAGRPAVLLDEAQAAVAAAGGALLYLAGKLP